MSATSSASCALSTHTSCQPRSRTASASLCSTPKAPGSSRARLPTIATMGMRNAGVTVSASIAYIQPTPEDPQNTLGPIGDLLLHPLLVPVVVLPPGVPLPRVVRERRLVDHGDALGLGADRLAHPAAAAGLHVRVVQAVGRHVEDGVRTGQPAQRALDALVEVHHGPHGAGRPLL